MPRSRIALLVIVGLVAAYVAFIAWYQAPYAGGADSSGYFNHARLLRAGEIGTPVRRPAGMPVDLISPRNFMPLGFRLNHDGTRLMPTYGVGLPLHFVALGWIGGLELGSTLTAIAAALAFAGLLYGTAREFGVRPFPAAVTALFAALSPLTLTYAFSPMSDLVAAAWALAAVFCALRAGRHSAWAAGAGAALAMAVLVRPTNLLLALPVLILLPAPRLRSWSATGLGALPGALFFGWYNHALYGRALTTGYGDVSSMFSFQHLPGTLLHYAYWLPILGTPLLLAALALPALAMERRHKLALLAWALAIPLFYAAYSCTHETWWYLRFLLPALPAFAIAAARALQAISWPTPRVAQWAPALGLVLALLWLVEGDRRFRVTRIELDERAYPQLGRWIATQLPADAVVLSYQTSGAIFYYSDRPVVLTPELGPDEIARLDAWMQRERRVLYAALFPEEEAALREQWPGRWEAVARLRQATVWKRLP